MRSLKARNFTIAVAWSLIGLVPGIAQAADPIADFYKGKQIRFIISFSAGGGYDLYARLLSRHMGKYIPGSPTLVPQNMAGAGGRAAANWLYNVAPKDGTAIATLSQNSPADQALKAEGVQFDAARFNWIGNTIVDNNIMFSLKESGYRTLDDVKTKGGLICGGSGAASPGILQPLLVKNLLGVKIKLLDGYPGGNDVNLALERGEVNCRGSNSWASTVATSSNWFNDQRLQVLVQFGSTKDPAISKYQGRDVPGIIDLATNEDDRKAVNLLVAGISAGRPVAAPPDVPADRVEALRRAFDAVLKDPEFIDDAKKTKLDLNPMSGKELQKIVTETVNTTDAVVKRSQELTENRPE